jgi:pimeloyl-ACP methyl ester carboxylesterase
MTGHPAPCLRTARTARWRPTAYDNTTLTEPHTLLESRLPPGVRSRLVEGINGLTMHLLEAGHETPGRPAVLLLHGFPELAFSWRHVLVPLARAGYHVIAPDQRGYGRTTGWDPRYDGDLFSFRMFNLVRDAMGLLVALGHSRAAAVIGHDFGSPVAAWCALLRPDLFRSVVLMSAPFGGPPALAAPGHPAAAARDLPTLDTALAALPRPRKHYQTYYGSRQADTDMRECPQGLHAFLRAYYHAKSADQALNQPHALDGWSAASLAELPTYYVMDRDRTMAETVAPQMPAADVIATCRWLPDADLAVYTSEYTRTGFQGGLQWYRCGYEPAVTAEHQVFAGRTIDVPAVYIAGTADWGIHQKPGEFERMQRQACTRFTGAHLIDGAGHWVQQEQPQAVIALLAEFLRRQAR